MFRSMSIMRPIRMRGSRPRYRSRKPVIISIVTLLVHYGNLSTHRTVSFRVYENGWKWYSGEEAGCVHCGRPGKPVVVTYSCCASAAPRSITNHENTVFMLINFVWTQATHSLQP